MTRDELKRYRSILAKIAEINGRIKSNTMHTTVASSGYKFPYVARGFSTGKAVETPESCQDMVLLRKLETQKEEIEDFVGAIDDGLTRQIFRYRYIDGKKKSSWQQIALKLGGVNSADNIRMMHNRYLTRQSRGLCRWHSSDKAARSM